MEHLIEQSSDISDAKGGVDISKDNAGNANFRERRRADFFDVIGKSLEISTPDQFCSWAKQELQYIFPHGMLICGIGQIEKNNAQIQKLLTCNFPHEYLQTLRKNGGMGSSPVIRQWLKTRRPVLFELAAQHAQTDWLERFKRFNLQNMAAHGQSDMNSHTTSYFSFSRIPGKLTPRHAYLLEMLVPHLHASLIRALKYAHKEMPKHEAMLPALSEREHEIMKWLSAGKTNWEISQVLGLSEYTIKSHVQRIFAKMKVGTRAQAVSKFLSNS